MQESTCPYHESRNQIIQDHGERIAVIEVEVEHMQNAQADLVERFDAAATKNEVAIKDMCAEVKKINLKLVGLFSEPGNHVRHKTPEEIEQEMLEREPIGWLNAAIKKVFKSPVFWALVGWAVIKIFFFGEYPWFTDKVRPYMKPAIEISKKEITASHQALHDAAINHLHDESGKPVLTHNGNGK